MQKDTGKEGKQLKQKEGRGGLNNKFSFNQYNKIIKYGAMKTSKGFVTMEKTKLKQGVLLS